jgi:hypothetical protein
MLRKMLSLGAVALVAVAFGVGTAAAKPGKADSSSSPAGWAYGHDGFSDGRLGN